MLNCRQYARGRLLDVGCGGKPYADILSVDRYLGVNVPTAGQAGAEVYASGLALPFARGSFDTVLCNQVMEHVPDPPLLMQEMQRVLRPGGYLILTTPQTWGLHLVPDDFYRYTEYGLRYLANQSGLEIIRVYPTSGLWVTLAQRICDVIFHTYGGARAPWVLRQALRSLCALIQLGGMGLEGILGKRGDTLDNVLVARKPRER